MFDILRVAISKWTVRIKITKQKARGVFCLRETENSNLFSNYLLVKVAAGCNNVEFANCKDSLTMNALRKILVFKHNSNLKTFHRIASPCSDKLQFCAVMKIP